MMDQFGVYERLSCFDNLKIYADIYGISHSKAKETLEYVGLGEAINKPASSLSKGMGQDIDLHEFLCILRRLFSWMSRLVD